MFPAPEPGHPDNPFDAPDPFGGDGLDSPFDWGEPPRMGTPRAQGGGPLPKVLAILAGLVLALSIVLIVTGDPEMRSDPVRGFLPALVAYVMAAAADTVDRRSRDRNEMSGRLVTAVVLQPASLVAAVAAAVLVAYELAL